MGKKKRGLFISFEGTEGSGKSTLMRQLAQVLQTLKYEVVTTREPGGNAVAEKIRDILLHCPMNPWTEILLYEASRSENISKTVGPALDEGAIVLCDRFTDSSLAYQAHARGLPWNRVKQLNQIATQGLKPDLTVFLDIDPAAGLLRAQNANRFEAEGLNFQKKVRAGFIKARGESPKTWFTLKVKQETPEQLAQIVLKELMRRFKSRLSLR